MAGIDADVEAVLQRIEKGGHAAAAGRVRDLCASLADEGEEPVNADSVDGLARLLDHPAVPLPELGASPDGLVQAQWSVGGGWSLAVEFLDGRSARYSMVHRLQRRARSDTVPLDDVPKLFRGVCVQ